MINDTAAAWRDAEFRKSSYSGGQNGSCVELAWRKSSHSGGANGSCVEVAQTTEAFGVRDSKHPHGPVLTLSVECGHLFVAAAKHGQLHPDS